MRYRTISLAVSALVLGSCLSLTGCARAPSAAPAAAPIPVTVSYPVERYVTDYADKVNFKEGALVTKGDVLFEIDPRTYQAMLDQARATVVLAEAQLRFKESQFKRDEKLVLTGAVTREEYEQVMSERDVAAATIASAKADQARRQLDLDFTRVLAPVSGRVSRMVVTPGNLVQSGDQAGGTLLTTIVSVDPMYAYFDVDERTVQRVGLSIREGKAESDPNSEWPVTLGLATEEGFPHRGTVNFVDNQVNPKTGTLRVRGVFPNEDQSLSAGFFARVRVPIGPPHQALLVSDRALDTDQGQKILYAVNDKNEVVSRPIRVGALHDRLRAIEDGLKQGERVIVNGLQLVRPGITVEPKLVDMPTPAARNWESGVRGRGGPAPVTKATP
jgi:RND family efflux transporter MFP subunit